MDRSKLILVTHRKPDLDAVASAFLWLKAHQISWDNINSYEMKFVNPGRRLEYDPKNNEGVVIIHFDTGLMHNEFNFDHHQLNTREISATGLVWQKFFTPGNNPAIDELVSLVNHIDNGKKYNTDDLVAKNLFSMGFYLSGGNKVAINEDGYVHTMVMGFSMLEAYLANHHEFQVFDKITQDMKIFDSPLGRTVLLRNIPGDSSAIRSYLRKYYGGKYGLLINTCIVDFIEGSIGIMVCIDPEEQESEHHSDNENDDYPDIISLGAEMQELHDKLKKLDPNCRLYLHQSKFVLFINRSHTIELPDVEMILRGMTRKSNDSDCSQAQ